MKKIIYLFGIPALVLFASCQEKLDNWYSATSDYDGRFVVATTCREKSQDNTSIEDGLEMKIYNTAANQPNEVWIEMKIAKNNIKGKFSLKGDATNFTDSTTLVKNILAKKDNVLALNDKRDELIAKLPKPASAGLEHNGIQLYTNVTLLEGKILSGKATTIGGNVSDSIYMKAIIHHDFILFESYQTPSEEWADQNVPEFDWMIKDGSNTPAVGWEQQWELHGYRYTGYPEDIIH